MKLKELKTSGTRKSNSAGENDTQIDQHQTILFTIFLLNLYI